MAMETQFEEQVSFGVAEAFRRMSAAEVNTFLQSKEVTQLAQTLRDASLVAAGAGDDASAQPVKAPSFAHF
jgi:hypothetical protein